LPNRVRSTRVRDGIRRRLRGELERVPVDPNTHAFVLATAFFTSLFFALGAWLPLVLVLRAVF